MIKEKGSNILGWIGVGITTIFSSIWAYWGSIENFHEGWYSVSIWENLFMLFFQYLLFAIVFVVLGVITLKWKIAGLILHILLAGFSIWFFFRSKFYCYRPNDSHTDYRAWASILLWQPETKEMGIPFINLHSAYYHHSCIYTYGYKSI